SSSDAAAHRRTTRVAATVVAGRVTHHAIPSPLPPLSPPDSPLPTDSAVLIERAPTDAWALPCPPAAAPHPAAGRVTRTVVPPPGVSSTRAVPPWAATSAATIASPSPEPPEARVRESSRR